MMSDPIAPAQFYSQIILLIHIQSAVKCNKKIEGIGEAVGTPASYLEAGVSKTNRLMLFREMIAIYYENHMEQMKSVGRTLSFSMLKQLARTVHPLGFKVLNKDGEQMFLDIIHRPVFI
jgi:hypothetical protein